TKRRRAGRFYYIYQILPRNVSERTAPSTVLKRTITASAYACGMPLPIRGSPLQAAERETTATPTRTRIVSLCSDLLFRFDRFNNRRSSIIHFPVIQYFTQPPVRFYQIK